MENNQEIELGEIRQKTIYGFFWEFSSKFVEYIITFLGGLILVRILQPYDYGLLALTYIFIRLASVLTEGGFSRYIYQKKDADDLDYSTALIANFLIALIMYLILFVSAPFISNFYKEPNMTLLLRVVSLSIVFHSLNITHLTILSINLNFRFTSINNIINFTITTTSALVLAYFNYGYWALVALSLAPSIIGVISLWFFSNIKFKIKFSKSRFINMLKFGRNIIPLDILSVFSMDIYTNIIGKLDTTVTVGMFNRAQQTHGYISMFTKYPLAKIMNPVFRKIQDNMELVRDTIVRVFEMTFFVNMSILILFAIFAEELFIILYTAKWIDAVWMYQILSIGAIFSPMNFTLSYVLISIGQSKLFIKIEWIIKIVQVAIIILFISSIKLILIGLVIFEILQLFVRLYFFQRHLKFDLKQLMISLLPYFGLLLILLIVNLLIKYIDLKISIYLELTCVVLINTVIVIFYGKINKLRPYNDIRDFMNELVIAIKQKLNF